MRCNLLCRICRVLIGKSERNQVPVRSLCKRRRWTVIGSLLTVVLCVVASSGCRKSENAAVTEAEVVIRDTQPAREKQDWFADQGYIGSEACRECHENITLSFLQHPMGQSAALQAGRQPSGTAESRTFDAGGFRYAVKRVADQWVHHQGRITSTGEVAEIDLPVQHVIGSGKNGQSFLVQRDNFLFMSPMTWYPAKGIWDLSPGYETNNSEFHRPVKEECLYCHTGGVKAVEASLNEYEAPAFHAHAIGCERCHGPGASHVAVQQDGGGKNNQAGIVNPAKLSPELREAVCQQCHLSGAVRVTKPHRRLFDYRPGQPLADAYAIFTQPGDGKEFVGHVEQMYQSRCFQGSEGQLGCISCHDPHSLPNANAKVAFYRERCVRCHEGEGCGLSLSKRTALAGVDDCAGCHMPKLETEIRHAAVTDHRVVITARQSESQGGGQRTHGAAADRLVAFPGDWRANYSPRVSARDEAIALIEYTYQRGRVLTQAEADSVLDALKEHCEKDGLDLRAMDALAEVYLATDRFEDAMELCHQVLDVSPDRLTTLGIVIQAYSETSRWQKVAEYQERRLLVNPWIVGHWYGLGQTYARLERWERCRDLAEKGKARFPTSIGLRHLLVESQLALGAKAEADAEFEEIVAFRPEKLGVLKDWYRRHPSRQAQP